MLCSHALSIFTLSEVVSNRGFVALYSSGRLILTVYVLLHRGLQSRGCFSGGNYSKRIELVVWLFPICRLRAKSYSAPRAKMTRFGAMVQFTRVRVGGRANALSAQFDDNRPLDQ